MSTKVKQTVQASGSSITFADLCDLVDAGRAIEVPQTARVGIRISPGDRPFDSDYYYVEVSN